MGEASLSLARLDVDRTHEVLVSLQDAASNEYLGQVALTLRLEPKEKTDRYEKGKRDLNEGN